LAVGSAAVFSASGATSAQNCSAVDFFAVSAAPSMPGRDSVLRAPSGVVFPWR
jgi:hypothetical protein